MLTVVNTPEGYANASLVHIFKGLIQADQALTEREKARIQLIIYKMRHGLPGNHEKVISDLALIDSDRDYVNWTPDQHGDVALELFDKFVASGQADETHITSILDLLEIIMEVGGVTASEQAYLERMNREFTQRYRNNITNVSA
jgi:hypothetical protein